MFFFVCISSIAFPFLEVLDTFLEDEEKQDEEHYQNLQQCVSENNFADEDDDDDAYGELEKVKNKVDGNEEDEGSFELFHSGDDEDKE